MINLTPIIDVVFLLLMFFMLASTFVNFAEIDLSLAGRTQAVAQPSAPMVLLSVRADGRFVVNGESVEPDGIAEALARALPEGQGRIIVRPAREATAEAIVRAVERARAAARGPVILAR